MESNSQPHSKAKPATVVTIGTFDGVHIGHKTIIDRLLSLGQTHKAASVVLTFFPHPRMVLQPDVKIKLINTINERTQLLTGLGVSHVIVHPFTKEFSRMSALAFVRDILVGQLGAKHLVIGYDHRFGRNRDANIEDLREFGTTYGFTVHEISAQDIDAVTVSSTKIRRALEEGDIAKANAYLGYNFSLTGRVVTGRGLGKDLGYPTANLALQEDYKIIPCNGVYVVRAKINQQYIIGITNIGTNPTVGGTERTIETYFLDFNNDLYQQTLTIEFLTRIRDEHHFDSTQALITAIDKDQEFARSYVAKNN